MPGPDGFKDIELSLDKTDVATPSPALTVAKEDDEKAMAEISKAVNETLAQAV